MMPPIIRRPTSIPVPHYVPRAAVNPAAEDPRHPQCEGAPYRPDVQAPVLALAYDFLGRTGTLDLPACCCADMAGTIALFERLDVHVQRLVTRAGGVRDTVYLRTAEGWRACL